jgi:hypothetical protein
MANNKNVYIEDYFEDDYYEGEMAITPLPDPPSRGQTPEVFAERGDAFLGALPRLAMEIDAVAIAMTNNATNATSTDSHTIASSGAKTFNTQIGKSYLVGMTVRAANTANGTIWMQGDVTAYNPSTGVLTITMNASQGAGTYSSWNLSLSSSSSSGGSLAQDFSVRSLTHAVGATVASATTINLTNINGNFAVVTGSTPISGATMTPGKFVWLAFTGPTYLNFHETNHHLNSGGVNVELGDGAMALYTYDGVKVRVIAFRATGKPVTEFTPEQGAPVGSCLIHFGSTAPANYLVCPTSQTNISRTTYAELFEAIGTTWGNGDWSTTFGMPWFWPDYTFLQANSNVGTSYPGEIKAHTHNYTDVDNAGSVNTGGSYIGSVGNVVTKATSSAGGGANIAAGNRILICVKYKSGA